MLLELCNHAILIIFYYILAMMLVMVLVNDLGGSMQSIRMRDKKGKILTSTDISIVIVNVIFGIAVMPFRMRRYSKILKIARLIETVLPQRNVKKCRRKSITLIMLIYIGLSSVIILDMVIWEKESLKENDGNSYIKSYLPYYILYYIFITQEIYISHLIYLLNLKLDTLNVHLEASDFPSFFFNMKMVNKYIDAPYLSTMPNGNCLAVLNTNMLEKRLFHLLNVHKNILLGVNTVNNSFSNGLVLMMFSCLIHLIITPYFLLAEIVKPDCDVVFSFLQVVWIVTHIARLLIIVEPCQSCSLEGQRTITLLCGLLGRCDITDNTRKIVEVFVTQASQQPVKFSCFHLFNLDRSVLTTLFGSIATYIVILFQFNTN
ncbi:unnamed protein product [Callosobruchus maculatus]|uniref:Gustatory receptor n=1 Tax=Callosobruchus maculatus TaxID=64391 RepID=A0A653DSB5_CALMS|nr:unnamed protein product [Callosobruchus maculatus]